MKSKAGEMETSSQKTLEDFPKFVVMAVRRGTKANEGYIFFELEGRFDRPINIGTEGAQWFWLLFGKRGCLCASMRSFDQPTNTAVLTFETAEEPDVVGHHPYLLKPVLAGVPHMDGA